MKFTSKDLLKAMGLKVGDRIKVNNRYYTIEINELSGLPVYANDKKYLNIIYLVDKNIEILPQPKRVGDLICTREINCDVCRIKLLCKGDVLDVALVDKLYNILEKFKESEYFDQEIYDLLKSGLDKEVE